MPLSYVLHHSFSLSHSHTTYLHTKHPSLPPAQPLMRSSSREILQPPEYTPPSLPHRTNSMLVLLEEMSVSKERPHFSFHLYSCIYMVCWSREREIRARASYRVQHTATQRTATHYNILQHTATHCNALTSRTRAPASLKSAPTSLKSATTSRRGASVSRIRASLLL